MSTICIFKFSEDVNEEILEKQIAVAIIYAECTFGKPKVRIGAAYSISPGESKVSIDISTEVGESIAQVFTGLMIRQLGEDGFQVIRKEFNIKLDSKI